VLVEFDEVMTTPGCEYTITRTWTATDDCGNVATASQVITVRDEEAPVLEYVEPLLIGLNDGDTLTVECGEVPPLDETSVTATDNCDEDVEIIFGGMTAMLANCEEDGYVSIVTFVWYAQDDCGYRDTMTLHIKVVDEEAPEFTYIPADVTINCEDDIPLVDSVEVIDNCECPLLNLDKITVTFEETSETGDCPVLFRIIRTWIATDYCGNVATATQVITVVDDTAPVFVVVPDDMTVDCNDIPEINLDDVIAEDNCDTELDYDYTEQVAGDCPMLIVRTFTATDDCGNTATATQTITVIDEIAPQFDGIPDDLVVECDVYVPQFDTPTATDNCDDDVMVVEEVIVHQDTLCSNNKVYEYIWTATDDCEYRSFFINNAIQV